MGLGTGISYLLFHGQFHYAIARRVSLGLTVPFATTHSDTSSVSAVGALLAGNYYLTEGYSGYNFEAGLGAFFVSKEVRSPASTQGYQAPTLYSTFGWKGRINRGRFSLGAAAGFQYIGTSDTESDLPDLQGILPLLTLCKLSQTSQGPADACGFKCGS